MQLHQAELCVNDEKGVKRLIELLGGHWGKTGWNDDTPMQRKPCINAHSQVKKATPAIWPVQMFFGLA